MSWSGKLKCFGKNNRGQLGYGDTQNRGDDADEMGDNLDYVDLGSGFNVSALATADLGSHMCAADQVMIHVFDFGMPTPVSLLYFVVSFSITAAHSNDDGNVGAETSMFSYGPYKIIL